MDDLNVLIQLFSSLSREQLMIVIQLLVAISFINVLMIFVLQLILDVLLDMIRSLVLWAQSRFNGVKKDD